MAFDEGLAERVSRIVADVDGVVEKRMFGGLAYLLFGNMSVGIVESDLIVRLPKEEYEAALEEPGVRPFDMTGRPMRGWAVVANEQTAEDDDLAAWVRRGVDFAKALPPK